MSRRGLLLFASMCVIWGVPYLMIRVAVKEMAPSVLVFARTGLSALVLLPLAFAQGAIRPVLARWKPFLLFAFLEIALPWIFLARAEQKLSSSLTALLIAAVPLVGATTAWFVGGDDRITARRAIGLVVGVLGVGALVGLDLHTTSALAIIEVGIVAFGYATGPLVLTRSLSDLPGIGVIAASLGLCAIIYAPAAALNLPGSFPSFKVTAAVLGLSLICTALAFIVFFKLIAEIGPVRSTVITYVNPAVAAILGVALLHEKFTAGMGVGFVLILAGSFLATRRDHPTRRDETAAAPAIEP